MSEIHNHPGSGADGIVSTGAKLIKDMVTDEASTAPVDVRPSAVVEKADAKLQQKVQHPGRETGKKTHSILRNIIRLGK